MSAQTELHVSSRPANCYVAVESMFSSQAFAARGATGGGAAEALAATATVAGGTSCTMASVTLRGEVIGT